MLGVRQTSSAKPVIILTSKRNRGGENESGGTEVKILGKSGVRHAALWAVHTPGRHIFGGISLLFNEGSDLCGCDLPAGRIFRLQEQGEILGTFCFILGEDPTYLNIYEGAWLNDEPYGVIHRMAASGKRKGVSEACLNWCFEHFENIRVDTHRDNKVMQHILAKYGFQRCGIIYVKNGTERIAYQRIL